MLLYISTCGSKGRIDLNLDRLTEIQTHRQTSTDTKVEE